MSLINHAFRSMLVGTALLACCIARAGEPSLPSDIESGLIKRDTDGAGGKAEPNSVQSAFGATGLDEVVMELIKEITNVNRDEHREMRLGKKEDEDRNKASQRERYNVAAQDAARKLVQLGKRSVPALSLVFRANYEKAQKNDDAYAAVYYATWALARIRSSDATEALGPLLANPAAKSDLRLMAVDAAGWEKNPQGATILCRAAESDPDLEIRTRALKQLSLIPEFWRKAEPTIVKALGDSNDDLRLLAAKACYFSHVFLSANDKLIELAEKDRTPLVRNYALLTLSRLRVRKAQPVLLRIALNENDDEKIRKQALATFSTLAEFPFHDTKSAQEWWEKSGRVAYEKLAATERQLEHPDAPEKTANDPDFAPVLRLNTAGAADPSNSAAPAAEIIDANGNALSTPAPTPPVQVERPHTPSRERDMRPDPEPESQGARLRRQRLEKEKDKHGD